MGLLGDEHNQKSDEATGTFVRPICMPHSDEFDVEPLYPFTENQLKNSNYQSYEYLLISGFGRTNSTPIANVGNMRTAIEQIESDELLKGYGAILNIFSLLCERSAISTLYGCVNL